MEISFYEELNDFLQPCAGRTPEEAKTTYDDILKEKKLRIKHCPPAKRSAFQMFRDDDEAMSEIDSITEEAKRNENRRPTVALVSNEFCENSATSEIKKKYEDLVNKEDERLEREYYDYRDGLGKRD